MGCRGGIGPIFKKFKPHLLMVLAEVGYTFLNLFSEASFKHGMNPHVYVTYRQLVAGVFVFPFAYFLEKKIRPKLTLSLFLEISLLSLLGISLAPNMYSASLRYTSPTFAASIANIVPSLTFLLAVLLRLEGLDRSTRGMAKIVGTLVSLVGVMIMTLYRGPVLRNLGHALVHVQGSTTIKENWIKGPILIIGYCISASLWFLMQGVVVSGLIFYIQLWCTKEKGPVFITTFNPLAALLIALLAYFALGEKLHMGSIIGGVIVIIGLYLLLWGKEGDHVDQIKSQEASLSYEEPKEGSQDKGVYLGGEGDKLRRSLDV
ncbi:WAT1-related protein At4g08300-like isoform X5 [Magnolia sinica]|uniref:WAT1-related protein At4g08300-like isoform X5 n=1 Tax=Magnolia sinica TaxID=86752 RepID=UPI00265955F2|nr:WAT1-related protein At4g08300-like isoform X5 [Magnolia sinica]